MRDDYDRPEPNQYTNVRNTPVYTEQQMSLVKKQLADERAKVAKAVEAFEQLKSECLWPAANRLAERALTAMQSSDALASIRRKVARECADWCDQAGMDLAARAIRAKWDVLDEADNQPTPSPYEQAAAIASERIYTVEERIDQILKMDVEERG